MSISETQAAKIRNTPGFIAALDQSGGSTPKALKLYGIEENTYSGDQLLAKAKRKGICGTKERSVIKSNNAEGIKAVVKQQFEIARQVLSHGLVPIVEPEVDIKNPDKKGSEAVLKKEILAELDKLPANQQVMLKLTIPDVDNFYAELIKHPRVLKVVALSGGYSRDEANKRLAKQNGMIASFSRALSEGLSAQQNDAEFNKSLDTAIQSIYDASKT